MTLYEEEPEVESQLASMGMTIDGLLAVVRAAGAGLASTTSYHPRSASGTYGYHEGTAALRRQLVPKGYDHDEDDNQPRTYSVEFGVSVILQTGDENTGKDTGVEPRSRNTHGQATERKIKTNDEQLLLPFRVARPNSEQDSDQGSQVIINWVLLYALVEDKVRAELSLPRAFESGKVTGWTHRILLPEQEFGGTNDALGADGDEGPDTEIAVEWK